MTLYGFTVTAVRTTNAIPNYTVSHPERLAHQQVDPLYAIKVYGGMEL